MRQSYELQLSSCFCLLVVGEKRLVITAVLRKLWQVGLEERADNGVHHVGTAAVMDVALVQ